MITGGGVRRVGTWRGRSCWLWAGTGKSKRTRRIG